jgi:AcrR family transcriptional regulator
VSKTAVESPEERIIRAATACFRRWGVAKTSMGDIASRAGMQRPQLYRHFASKDALIVSAIVHQARELSRRRRQRFEIGGPVDALMIESVVAGHDDLMADEFASSTLAGDGGRLLLRLLAEEPALREAEAEWWCPVLNHGRARGEIREDLTDDEIMDWFLLMQINMAEHADLFSSPERVRNHVTKYVIPAVLAHR